MPQSLSAIFIHLVFSTKERRPFLKDPVTRDALHAYLGGISKTLDCPPITVGGADDHVHILARFGRSITQAEWVKELKRVSNLWLKEQGIPYAEFQWQGGYADFLVSRSNLDRVRNYIADQEAHHRKINFQDELRSLLRKHDVEWDERFLWEGVATPLGLAPSWRPSQGSRVRQPWAGRLNPFGIKIGGQPRRVAPQACVALRQVVRLHKAQSAQPRWGSPA